MTAALPPPTAVSAPPARRPGWATGLRVVVLVAVWLAFMQPMRLLTPSLDASWQMMLGYAHDHGLRFGRDLLPTHGPAAFLIVAAPAGDHLGARLAWMIIGNAALAWLFCRLGWQLGRLGRVCYFAYVLLVLSPFAEWVHGLAIVILGLALLRPEVLPRASHVALAAAAIGGLALFKFTHFTLGTFIVVTAGVAALASRQWGRAAAAVAGFGLAYVAGWVLLGQPLSTLFTFLRLSAEISSGYVDAMSLSADPRIFWWGLATLIAGAVYLVVLWRTETRRVRAGAMMAILAATWFLNWKHGFVRADAHTLTLFLAGLFPAVAYPALTGEPVTARQRHQTWLLAFAALGGIATASSDALTHAPATLLARLRENLAQVSGVLHPGSFAARQRQEFSDFALARRLPRIAQLVGQETVDVFGTEQGMAILGGYHYTPRPVFQDYFAFTPTLARRNERFYASPQAPRFVLEKYETIDGRVPGLDDARARLLVYQSYGVVAEENGWLLWERVSAPQPLRFALSTALHARFGEEVTVPEFPRGPSWVQIEVRPSLLGRLRAFLYKPPALALTLTGSRGETHTHRLVREAAADGFLIRPYFPDQPALTRGFTGEGAEGARSLRVTVPAGDEDYFLPEIAVTFRETPGLKLPDEPRLTGKNFRMLSWPPIRVDSPHPWGPYLVAGRELFFIHAPGEMEFVPHITATYVAGMVGLPPSTYADAHKTDGVEIVIEHISVAGRRTVLWRKFLDPTNRPEDRGMHPFRVAMPGRGHIILHNNVGPQGDATYDWTLWDDIRFE